MVICAVNFCWAGFAFAVDAPGNFDAENCTDTTITWKWDAVSGADGYEIHDDTTNTIVAEAGAGATSVVETGLSPNTEYIRHCHAYTLSTSAETATISPGQYKYNRKYPINIFNNYARCQMLYLQSEINYAGAITKIRFQQTNSYSPTIHNCTIYMYETDNTTLTDWVGSDNGAGTKVFDGDLTARTSPGWFEIILDTSFNYSNTKNLLISFRQQDGSWELFPNWKVSSATYRCVEGGDDADNPPDVSGCLLPNVQLVVEVEEKTYSAPSNTAEAWTLAAPTILQINGCGANESEISAPYPKFSAQYNDKPGDIAVAYQIQLLNSTAHVVWDSGKCGMSNTPAGARTPDIEYAGPDLATGETYHWRIKLWDNGDVASPWSEYLYFTFSGEWIIDGAEDYLLSHPHFEEHYGVEYENNDVIPDVLDIKKVIVWQENNSYVFEIRTNGDIQTVFSQYGDNAHFGILLDNTADSTSGFYISDFLILTGGEGSSAALLTCELDVIDYYLDVSIEDNSIIISVAKESIGNNISWTIFSGFALSPGIPYPVKDTGYSIAPIVDIAAATMKKREIYFSIHTSDPKIEDFIEETDAPVAPAGTANDDLPNTSQDNRSRTEDVNLDNRSDWLVRRWTYDDDYKVEIWVISANATHTSLHDFVAKRVYKDTDFDNKWDPGEDGSWIDICPFEGGTAPNEILAGGTDAQNNSYLKSITKSVADQKQMDNQGQMDADDDGDGRQDNVTTLYNASTITVTITHIEKDNAGNILSEVTKKYTTPFSNPYDIPPDDNTIDNNIKIELFEITTDSLLPSSRKDAPYATQGETFISVKLETSAKDYSQNGSFTWEVISGNFPPGLSLNSNSGAITGNATTVGTYEFTVKVTWSWVNAQGQQAISKEKVFSIAITEE